MATFGYLGDSPGDGIVFTVSRDLVRTLRNMKWGGSARYAVHQRHVTDAMTEFTGLDPDNFTFDMTLSKELGTDPMADIKKLWKYQREGEAVALTIGDHCYGKYRWNVKKFESKIEHTDKNGTLHTCVVSVSLQAYAKR